MALRRRKLRYFMRPAAVSARGMTAPTPLPRRRGAGGGPGRGGARRERAGDDGADVDTATPRRARRLGTAAGLRTTIKRRERPQHRGEIRHLDGGRSNRRSWLDGL